MPGDEYRISLKDNHYELYINGIFYCSADSMSEAANELEEYLESDLGGETFPGPGVRDGGKHGSQE